MYWYEQNASYLVQHSDLGVKNLAKWLFLRTRTNKDFVYFITWSRSLDWG